MNDCCGPVERVETVRLPLCHFCRSELRGHGYYTMKQHNACHACRPDGFTEQDRAELALDTHVHTLRELPGHLKIVAMPEGMKASYCAGCESIIIDSVARLPQTLDSIVVQATVDE